MEAEPPRDASRPPFDWARKIRFFHLRTRDTPDQPLKEQIHNELKQLLSDPCAFTLGNKTWREIFAISSVRSISATLLLVLRWLCFVGQTTVVICSVWNAWAVLYFFTLWTNILIIFYYLGLCLCSTVAICVDPPPPNPELRRKNMLLADPGKDKSGPFLLRLVEYVSSIIPGASLVTCVGYWTALYTTGEQIRGWTSYVEHTCLIPAFMMTYISRVPYRLQHMWVGTLYAFSYLILCCIVAFVPLTTWKGRVGYIYNALKYPTHPVQAWLTSILFAVSLPPLTYVLFWFVLRHNNPKV